MTNINTMRNQLINMIEYLPEPAVSQLLKLAQMYQMEEAGSDTDPFYSESNIRYLESVIADIESGKSSYVVKTMEELEAMAHE